MTNPTLSAIFAIVGLFFKNNPTVAEIETILPPVLEAVAAAKAGTAFSVSFPEGFGGHPGVSTFSWAPN